jgi:hypothetical protein
MTDMEGSATSSLPATQKRKIHILGNAWVLRGEITTNLYKMMLLWIAMVTRMPKFKIQNPT